MTGERIDKLLVLKGLATSRTLAQRLLVRGVVEVKRDGDWQKVHKASEKFSPLSDLRVLPNDDQRFVSRAGLKLEGALRKVSVSVLGLRALDIGQSTGGFTDCLLAAGARRVVGVDVGHGQLHGKLREDQRVRCFEGINARELSLDMVDEPAFDLVVMDVSFISQTLILPQLNALMAAQATLISLVKPQFEVGSKYIGKGGLVNDVGQYDIVAGKIGDVLRSCHFTVLDYFESAIQGSDGNREFFVVARVSK